jgi:hypothetical protein
MQFSFQAASPETFGYTLVCAAKRHSARMRRVLFTAPMSSPCGCVQPDTRILVTTRISCLSLISDLIWCRTNPLVNESEDSTQQIRDDRSPRVRFPAGTENFSLHHRVQNGSGAHPASYPMGTVGSFLGGKAAGV